MKQPLDGIRVIDLTRMLTGGYAAMLLGDLGAEVIKIEAPGTGDPLRKMPPHFAAGESAYFLAISRNKKSVTLDLRQPEGQRVLHDLAARADVVFDNFRPGVLQRLGADYETLSAINPKLVCCSISSYGQTGPLKNGPGFDLVIQALSGMMSYTGEPGRVPVRMGAPMGDLAGSMFACTSICAALLAAERSGQGRRIDLSLLDCLVSMHTYVSQYHWIGGELPAPAGSGHMSVVPYRAYRTADGYLTIAVFVEKFWQLLCNVIGRPELGVDERYDSTAKRLERRDEVDRLIEEAFAAAPTARWIELLEREGVPAAPVLGVDEVLEHPQILARNMVVEMDLPGGGGRMKMIGNPVVQPDVDEQPLAPTPRLGEHTDQVLRDVLGYDGDRIAELWGKKVL